MAPRNVGCVWDEMRAMAYGEAMQTSSHRSKPLLVDTPRKPGCLTHLKESQQTRRFWIRAHSEGVAGEGMRKNVSSCSSLRSKSMFIITIASSTF
ncbi:hypothetical protein ALO71_200076 [Pseudomonas amygdali pv. dendropanacis]|uniref:50S ribosomal protein L17 n=1 Tax=Pseudomonas amygdali pv. dendropanacis TaxID=235272 RepID=A0A0P9PJH9_PSEA0|nr:hypothetical protein ALO71_200076 [Pseudomonas amygdali pv. dendropanacis]